MTAVRPSSCVRVVVTKIESKNMRAQFDSNGMISLVPCDEPAVPAVAATKAAALMPLDKESIGTSLVVSELPRGHGTVQMLFGCWTGVYTGRCHRVGECVDVRMLPLEHPVALLDSHAQPTPAELRLAAQATEERERKRDAMMARMRVSLFETSALPARKPTVYTTRKLLPPVPLYTATTEPVTAVAVAMAVVAPAAPDPVDEKAESLQEIQEIATAEAETSGSLPFMPCVPASLCPVERYLSDALNADELADADSFGGDFEEFVSSRALGVDRVRLVFYSTTQPSEAEFVSHERELVNLVVSQIRRRLPDIAVLWEKRRLYGSGRHGESLRSHTKLVADPEDDTRSRRRSFRWGPQTALAALTDAEGIQESTIRRARAFCGAETREILIWLWSAESFAVEQDRMRAPGLGLVYETGEIGSATGGSLEQHLRSSFAQGRPPAQVKYGKRPRRLIDLVYGHSRAKLVSQRELYVAAHGRDNKHAVRCEHLVHTAEGKRELRDLYDEESQPWHSTVETLLDVIEAINAPPRADGERLLAEPGKRKDRKGMALATAASSHKKRKLVHV